MVGVVIGYRIQFFSLKKTTARLVDWCFQSRGRMFSVSRPNVCQDPLCICSCLLFSPPLKNASSPPKIYRVHFWEQDSQSVSRQNSLRTPRSPNHLVLLESFDEWAVLTAQRSCWHDKGSNWALSSKQERGAIVISQQNLIDRILITGGSVLDT